MRVLITGGAGFIGSHPAERLVARGDQVTALDDLSTGRMENLATLAGHERFAYRLGSVTDAPLVAALVDCADVVVHLAAAVGVRLIIDRPVHTIETNVRGTEVLLSATARAARLVLLASTSEVYGKGAQVPFRTPRAYASGFEDMERRVPDVAKLRRATGFAPTTPLEQIVADVLADQRGRLGRS